MKYRLNTTNYHDFATFAVNKLPPPRRTTG